MRLRKGHAKIVAVNGDGSITTIPSDVVRRSSKLKQLDFSGERENIIEAPPGWAQSWLHFVFLMRTKQGVLIGQDVEKWNVIDYLRVRSLGLHCNRAGLYSCSL